MAEKDVTGDTVANRPSAATGISDSAEELIRSAPDPTTKGGKIYRVLYPTNRFVMEGMPVVTNDGVRLTAEQAKAVLPAAEASGVKIVEVES